MVSYESCGGSHGGGGSGRHFVDRLVDELLADDTRFVSARQTTGYRNKMTYTLHPALQLSALHCQS